MKEHDLTIEELSFLKSFRLLIPEQQLEIIALTEKTAQRNQSVISHWLEVNQNQRRMAPAA